MERLWVFDRLAISVQRIDFVDPKVAHEPDGRERGVRIEVRPVQTDRAGSIYASWTRTVQPGICRIDFLESAPGKADRMHWHPDMHDGEPEDRTFDTSMPPDPVGWLATFLRDDIRDFVARAGVPDAEADLEAVTGSADEITGAVAEGLAWAREPWPEAVHDERGMADVPGA